MVEECSSPEQPDMSAVASYQNCSQRGSPCEHWHATSRILRIGRGSNTLRRCKLISKGQTTSMKPSRTYTRFFISSTPCAQEPISKNRKSPLHTVLPLQDRKSTRLNYSNV